MAKAITAWVQLEANGTSYQITPGILRYQTRNNIYIRCPIHDLVCDAIGLVTKASDKDPNPATPVAGSTPGPSPAKPTIKGVTLKEVCPAGNLGPFHHGTKCTGYYDENGKLVGIRVAGTTIEEPFVTTKGLVHAGVDILAPAGSEIYPIADGVVDDVIVSDRDKDFNSLGYMVIVEHNERAEGKPTYSLFLHMRDKPSVSVGNKVTAGKTLLGLVGATGSARFDNIPHTHFEIRHFSERFSGRWENIYGVERPKNAAKFDEKDFAENWMDPEKFLLAKSGAGEVAAGSAPAQRTEPMTKPAAAVSASSPAAQTTSFAIVNQSYLTLSLFFDGSQTPEEIKGQKTLLKTLSIGQHSVRVVRPAGILLKQASYTKSFNVAPGGTFTIERKEFQ